MSRIDDELDKLIEAWNSAGFDELSLGSDPAVDILNRMSTLADADIVIRKRRETCPRCGGEMRRAGYESKNCKQDYGACGFLWSRQYRYGIKTDFSVTRVNSRGEETTHEDRDDLLLIEFIKGKIKIIKGGLL